MKLRPVVAISLLVCAGSVAAQSSVTVYGVVDMNIEYVNKVGAIPVAANSFNPGPAHSVVRMDSGGVSGSRWGLRGVEELGSGLKSLFVLESGFNLDTGTLQQSGRLFGRQAFVGVQHQYGQLTLGRQYTSLFETLANFMPMAFATQYEPAVVLAGANFREDNMVKYTGTFGPVNVLAHWSFGTGLALPATVGVPFALGGNGEVPGQFRRDSAYGAALAYANGAFGATIAYDQFNPTIAQAAAPASAGNGRFKKATVAASYSVGAAKIMAGYRWGQNRNQSDVEIQRDNFYWIGAAYQATPNLSLAVEYVYDDVKNQFGDRNAANQQHYALLANYAFSKRTDAYLTAAYGKNAGLNLESAGQFYATSLSLGNTYALGNGQSNILGVALGVRHKF
jgi:predicted porin